MGKKISVHGVPASDVKEYQGMPMFAEVGPLILDPKIKQEAQSLLQKEEISFDKVQINGKRLQVKLLPNKLTAAQEIMYNSITSVFLDVSNQVIIREPSYEHKLTFQNNIARDIFVLVLREL